MKQKSEIMPVKGIKIIFPIIIGFAVVIWLFKDEFDPNIFNSLTITYNTVFWLIVAVLMMLIRDVGYILRLKILSYGDLNWIQCFRIIMLWEFTSAVTPSAIGGTSVALYYIHKEGVGIGRSSAIVLATSFLDELYFILMFPLLLLFLNPEVLFNIGSSVGSLNFSNQFFYFAIIGYSLKFIFTCFVFYGLFINPYGLRNILIKLFSFKYLKRWEHKIEKIGDELVLSSEELKSKNIFFWIKSFLATFFSWTARYWVVNCLFLAFFFVNDHLIIFARQLIMWIMMLIMPTPGGSGFAEYLFFEYLGEFIPIAGLIAIIVILWRLITYYLYLVIGVLVLPAWIRNKFNS